MKNVKKAIIYLSGMFLTAIGVNLSKIGGLGISPVSSVPYACELIWGVELGAAVAIIYMILILLQFILLRLSRRRFKPIQLLQLICTYVFSFFVTLTGPAMMTGFLPQPPNWFASLAYCLVGVVFIGAGVALYLIPMWIPMPAEGLAVALVEISDGKLPLHRCKIIVDVSLVTVSAALSLTFLGRLVSVREGTLIDAVCVGGIVGFVHRRFKEKIMIWVQKTKP
ncbi:membrane protein [Synergistales bacterium]|nr:membrane protein [Synergistales bacterium]